ncbi:hypothetical protein SAMN05414139_02324 [Burkholderia sp. D7]|jgi:hypothetical protein|nr:hypothetical protein SAMN05414139_02324 [Burkholderia sp. D7]
MTRKKLALADLLIAPAAGDKIALNHRLHQLGRGL